LENVRVCTSPVQHESLVNVEFMIGTLKSDLQLFLDGLEVLDMANVCLQKHEYKELKIEEWDAYHVRMETLLAFRSEVGRVSLRRA